MNLYILKKLNSIHFIFYINLITFILFLQIFLNKKDRQTSILGKLVLTLFFFFSSIVNHRGRSVRWRRVPFLFSLFFFVWFWTLVGFVVSNTYIKNLFFFWRFRIWSPIIILLLLCIFFLGYGRSTNVEDGNKTCFEVKNTINK